MNGQTDTNTGVTDMNRWKNATMHAVVGPGLVICFLLLPVLSVFGQEENGTDGFWMKEFGDSRWEWSLDGETYLFSVYREDLVRSGSRGRVVRPEDDQIDTVFIAEEITRDGENWEAVQLDPEDASVTVVLIPARDRLRFAEPDRTQFFIEYTRFDPEQDEPDTAED
jgi:hypothetical protein